MKNYFILCLISKKRFLGKLALSEFFRISRLVITGNFVGITLAGKSNIYQDRTDLLKNETSNSIVFIIYLYPTSYKSAARVEFPHPICSTESEVLMYLWRMPHSSWYSPYHSKDFLPRFLKNVSQYSFWRNSLWSRGSKFIVSEIECFNIFLAA